MAGGHGAGRVLRHHDAGRGDPVEQGLVRRGIAAIDTAGQHGDGGAARGQRAAVGGAVDPDRSPGDHREPGCRQPGAEFARHVRAVSGGGPRPDDRGGLIAEFVERTRPTNPQRDRGRQIAPRGLRFRPDPAASGPKAHLIQQAATALLATAPLAALRIAARRHRTAHRRPARHRPAHRRPAHRRPAHRRPARHRTAHRRGHARPAVIRRAAHNRPVHSRRANPRPVRLRPASDQQNHCHLVLRRSLGRRSVGRMRRSPAQ